MEFGKPLIFRDVKIKVSRPAWSRDHFFGLGLSLGLTVTGLGLALSGLGLGLGLTMFWSH